jgi:hypothetical protein
MTISMYQASVPPALRALANLSTILEKAEAHCAARKIEPEALLNARLYPDMLSFVHQVQIVSDNAKGAAARLAGIAPPSYPDNETSFAELKTRLAKTMEFVKSVPATQIDGSEGREIVLPVGGGRSVKFKGLDYLLGFFLPNLYFHVATAYDILRHSGVEIGKRDYLGDS